MQDKVNQFFRTIPLAKAVLLAVVFLLSAAFAGGCWWLKASAEKDAAIADDKFKRRSRRSRFPTRDFWSGNAL